MIDLAPYGLAGEPTPRASIAAGADVVCFSTDKVLGGPQGGALVGRAEAIEKARRDPLARALRLGRLPLVALEATVALYLEGRLDEIPALAALRRPLDEVRARAEAWQAALGDARRGGASWSSSKAPWAAARWRRRRFARRGWRSRGTRRRWRRGSAKASRRWRRGSTRAGCSSTRARCSRGEDEALLRAVVAAYQAG